VVVALPVKRKKKKRRRKKRIVVSLLATNHKSAPLSEPNK
jgi:hypothetical protein